MRCFTISKKLFFFAFIAGVICAGAAGSDAVYDALADRSAWQPQGAALPSGKSGASWRFTNDGLEILAGSPGAVVVRQARKTEVAGSCVDLEIQFKGAVQPGTCGGIRFPDLVTAGGQPVAVTVFPNDNTIQVGDAKGTFKPSFEDPLHFVLELVFSESKLSVSWGGKEIGRTGIKAIGPTALELQLTQGALLVSRLAVRPLAGDKGLAAGKAVDVRVDLGQGKALPSPWADYFGTHYSTDPERSGITGRTVRGFGAPHLGVEPDEAKRAPDSPKRKGPFTGREFRLGLKDFGNGKITGPDLFPQIIQRKLAVVYGTTEIVRPSLQPFDKDLLYWTLRVIYEAYPAATNYLYWQIGNEVVSGHFDPKGIAKEAKRFGPWEKHFGYDLSWKRNYYVQDYLAPAIEAIERVGKDLFGNSRAIKICLGSMNPYNDVNQRFLKEVMDSAFDGRQAPTLKGEPVWKHFDLMTVHYMMSKDESVATMQSYVKDYLRPGKVRGLWVTEEHGAQGQGPVTILSRGLRYLSWVANDNLDASQTRLMWWGDSQRPGGIGYETEIELGRFFQGLNLRLATVACPGGRVYCLAGLKGNEPVRILALLAPNGSASIPAGKLDLAGLAGSGIWHAQFVQYSTQIPPKKSPAPVASTGHGLAITLNRSITEPAAVWFQLIY